MASGEILGLETSRRGVSTRWMGSPHNRRDSRVHEELISTLEDLLNPLRSSPSRCIDPGNSGDALQYQWEGPIKAFPWGRRFSVRSGHRVALDHNPALALFREGVSRVTDAQIVTSYDNERLHLWVVFKDEPDLYTKLRVAGVFQEVYEKLPEFKYDFLMMTEQEYEWRTSK